MHAYLLPRQALTAHELFKLRYPVYVRWSTLIALAVVVIGFLASPRYVPHPYQLVRPPIELVNVEPIYEIPAPPPELPAPQPYLEPVDDKLAVEDEIPPSLLNWEDFVRTGPKPPPAPPETYFIPSSQKPELLYFASPDYPEIARMSGLEGTVVVVVEVGPAGTVLGAEIQQGIHPLLNRAALSAARKCRFSPGLQRGQPVKVRLALPYRFSLQ
jgi:protein TonB